MWGFFSNDKNSVFCSVMTCNLVEVCVCVLPLQCSGILRSIDWYLVTDLSVQPISPIFKVKQSETDWLSRNFGKKLPL